MKTTSELLNEIAKDRPFALMYDRDNTSEMMEGGMPWRIMMEGIDPYVPFIGNGQTPREAIKNLLANKEKAEREAHA